MTQCFYHCFCHISSFSGGLLLSYSRVVLLSVITSICKKFLLAEENKKKAVQELNVIKCTLAQWSPVCGNCIERARTEEENFFSPVLQKDAARLSKIFCIVYEALNSSEEVKKEAAGLMVLSKALCNLFLSSTFAGKQSFFFFSCL